MTADAGKPEVTLIGAGLVGALLATLLAQRGFGVNVCERRSDPRIAGYGGGRSINLALAERGLHGLRMAGLSDDIIRLAVMMRGRMVHHQDGRRELLRYGRDDNEVIWSINRARLNLALIEAAERAGARFHFSQRRDDARFAAQVTLDFRDDVAGTRRSRTVPFAIGTDGAGSALRAAMNRQHGLGERIEELGHGYKELEVPALPDFPIANLPPAAANALARGERFALEPNALHIWPRGNFMCIALPNADGSFTVTLFLPNVARGSAASFASTATATRARTLFAAAFADLLPLLPDFDADYTNNPVGVLSTLYLDRWHVDGRALLLGDAAHAIVPFHGQGMNCGFEDAVELADLLASDARDLAATFAEFERRRRPNASAIAAMAIENYTEMRDSVADAGFLLRRELARVLGERQPDRFMPRYAMVTFTRMPYAEAYARGKLQETLLHAFCDGQTRLDEIDLAAADARVRETLQPLPR